MNTTQELTGPRNRWGCVGQSIYRKGDTYVWRDERQWFRGELPPMVFRAALASIMINPVTSMFTDITGPYTTMKAAKKSRRRSR